MKIISCILWLSLCLSPSSAFSMEKERQKQIESGVLRIINVQGEKSRASGTGFLINNEGYLVTNHHVVKDADRLIILDGGLEKQNIKFASVVWVSPHYDLAVIQAKDLQTNRHPLTLSSPESSGLDKGDEVWKFGFPGGSDVGALEGVSIQVKIDSGKVRVIENRIMDSQSGDSYSIVEHGATVNPGDSGGPLTNQCGNVIAVNSSKASMAHVEGTFWAINVKYLIDQLNAKGIKYQLDNSACMPQIAQFDKRLFILIIAGFAAFAIALFWILKNHKKHPAWSASPSEIIRREIKRIFEKERPADPTPQPAGWPRPQTPPKQPPKAESSKKVAGYLIGYGNLKGVGIRLDNKGSMVFGRSESADFVIDSSVIGRQHAVLTWNETGEVRLEDLQSSNGTFIEDNTMLNPGHPVTIIHGQSFYFADTDNLFLLVPPKPIVI
ncbi:MAG: trypsin-like peptidase domain-containing protein [Methylobacter sp.]